MATEKLYKSDTATNIEIDLNIGEVIVEATDEVKHADVWIRTTDDSGPSADAVNATQFRDRGDTLRIRTSVKTPSMSVSGNVVSFNGGVSGVTIINGQVYTGDYVYPHSDGRVFGAGGTELQPVTPQKFLSPRPVQVIVKVPVGANLVVETVSASTLAEGRYHKADLNTVSGSIELEEAYVLEATSVSGRVKVHRVTDRANVRSTSGSILIRHWEGDDLRVKNVSGSVKIYASDAPASGRVDIKNVSGSVSLDGSRHIDDVIVKTVSGSKSRS